MFCCPIALFLWTSLKETLYLSSVPRSSEELISDVLCDSKGRRRSNLLFVFAGAMWSLWKTRNDLVFNDKVIQTPEVVIRKTMSFLMLWKKLLAEKNVHQVEEVLGEMQQACDLDCAT